MRDRVADSEREVARAKPGRLGASRQMKEDGDANKAAVEASERSERSQAHQCLSAAETAREKGRGT